jgi:signal transduction histidine kinase
MTIRRRLSLSFLVILLLFALNLVIYSWGNTRRQLTAEALRRAVARQGLISELSQNLNDLEKQVKLRGQVATENTQAGVAPEDIAQFKQQLLGVEDEIQKLSDLAEPEARADFASFADAYRQLSSSWQIYFENFGRNQTKAITEMALGVEPLTQEVIQKRLPQLKSDEKTRVNSASANFSEVALFTERMTLLIFALSAAVALGVAVLVSGRLTRGLGRLEEGVSSIGSGDLDRRIEVGGRDELADLAAAFNGMTGKLSQAHDRLTHANDQEKQKSQELEQALERLHHAQDQLVVQQKLASLGSLTAGIAHEIKNPLNFITNFAEVSVDLVSELRESMEAQEQKLNEKEAENIQDILTDLQQNVIKIREHGKRADGIVRNMLMHSRGHSADFQPTNLNALVSEYVKLAFHGMRAQDQNFNVGIEENFDAAMGPVNVVAHDLSRVILNIANNACYAAYEKKTRLNGNFSPVVTASTKSLGKSVEIRIRDNGDGIPDSVKQKIFEPFFTTKPSGAGTGLGLSMSYEIVVQQHKGQLRVESEPGQFAEFIITLPNTTA